MVPTAPRQVMRMWNTDAISCISMGCSADLRGGGFHVAESTCSQIAQRNQCGRLTTL
jgi:hypothetical protein